MADHYHRRCGRLINLASEIATEHHMNAEYSKEIGTDPCALHHLCRVPIGDVESRSPGPRCQVFEGTVTALSHAKPGIPQNPRPSPGRTTVDLHNAVRLRIRQGTKEHGVDNGEQAGICADTEGQR